MTIIGKKVKTNHLYFTRFGETIEGQIVKVDGAKVWVKNQYKTISIIHQLCITD